MSSNKNNRKRAAKAAAVQSTQVLSDEPVKGVVAKPHHSKWLCFVLDALAVVLVATLGFIGFNYISNHPVDEPERVEEVAEEANEGLVEGEQEPETPAEEEPEEQAPTSTGGSTGGGGGYVAPSMPGYMPRYFSVPAVGLNYIPVVVVGVENGAMGTPKSDYVVGWYNNSELPGEPGTAIITGHGGALGTGILKTIHKAPVGSKIIIQTYDGRVYNYTIREMVYQHIGEAADNYMSTAASSIGGRPTMTVITCIGTWLPAQRTYDHRLFVRATMD